MCISLNFLWRYVTLYLSSSEIFFFPQWKVEDLQNVTGAMIVHWIPQSHKHATCIVRGRPTLVEVQEVVLARGGSFHFISYAAINLCGGFRFIYSGCYFMESTVGTDLCQDPWNDRFTWLPSVWGTYLFPCKTIKGRQGRPIDVRIVHIIGEHESNISNSTVMTLYTSSLFPSCPLRCLFII